MNRSSVNKSGYQIAIHVNNIILQYTISLILIKLIKFKVQYTFLIKTKVQFLFVTEQCRL